MPVNGHEVPVAFVVILGSVQRTQLRSLPQGLYHRAVALRSDIDPGCRCRKFPPGRRNQVDVLVTANPVLKSLCLTSYDAKKLHWIREEGVNDHDDWHSRLSYEADHNACCYLSFNQSLHNHGEGNLQDS